MMSNKLGVIPYPCEGQKEANAYASLILQQKVDAIEQDIVEMRRQTSPSRNSSPSSPKRTEYLQSRQMSSKFQLLVNEEPDFLQMTQSNGFEDSLYFEEDKVEEAKFDK